MLSRVISRILLGLTFTMFGLNGFLHFIKLPPHAGLAGQFMGALIASKYQLVVCALETVAGVLLLVNRFVPLALLAPVLVNIALYHFLLAPQGAGAAVVSIVLWAILAYRERAAWAAPWECPDRSCAFGCAGLRLSGGHGDGAYHGM